MSLVEIRMVRAKRGVSLTVLFLLASTACSDVGDNTARGGATDDGSADATGTDATMEDADAAAGEGGGGDAGETGTPEDATADQGAEMDVTADAAMDSLFEATPGADAQNDAAADGLEEATVDASPEAAAEAAVEGGPQDSGGQDSMMGDSSSADTGTMDTGSQDAPNDVHDAAADTGGGGLVPCTSPGQTGCVPCDGNDTNNVCTATQAIILQRDIALGNVASGHPTADSCFTCLINTGCINGGGFSGMECGDLSGTVGGGAQASETKTAACLATLQCILPATGVTGSTCGGTNSSTGISNCFCGTNGPTSSACASLANFVEPTSASGPNGACDTMEFDGFGYVSGGSNNTTVLGAFTVPTTGSGMANAILSCAGTNTGALASCPQCY
jgi:hypothetical protein